MSTAPTTAPAVQTLNATLTRRVDITSGLATFDITPDNGQLPEFLPGQFCTLGLPADEKPLTPDVLAALEKAGKPKPGPRLIRRAYSIASSPAVRTHLELFITLVPEGRLTPKLFSLPVGGKLFLAPEISGHFTMEDAPPHKNVLVISTGTGLAPFMSMLRAYRGKNRWRKFVVIHGARHSADLGYAQELSHTSDIDPTVQYISAVTREPEGSTWQGLRGRVTTLIEPDKYKALTGDELLPENTEVYLCGNPDMIDQVRQMLEARAFVTASNKTPGNIHFERYW